MNSVTGVRFNQVSGVGFQVSGTTQIIRVGLCADRFLHYTLI